VVKTLLNFLNGVAGLNFRNLANFKKFRIILIFPILYILLSAIWFVNTQMGSGGASAGTLIASNDVSGLKEASIKTVAEEVVKEFSESEVEVLAKGFSKKTTFGEIGISIDSDEIVREALIPRTSGFILVRPIKWLTRSVDYKEIPLTPRFDLDDLNSQLNFVLGSELSVVEEPKFVVEEGKISAISGIPGVALDTSNIDQLIDISILNGEPYIIKIPGMDSEPMISLEKAQALAAEVDVLTQESILISVLDKTAEITPNNMKPWFIIEMDDNGKAIWAIDEAVAIQNLNEKLPNLGGAGSKPAFKIIDNRPILIPAQKATCCGQGTAELLKTVFLSEPKTAGLGRSPKFPTMASQCKKSGRRYTRSTGADKVIRRGHLEPLLTKPDAAYERLASLGVVEEVSSCTTSFTAGQERSANIQKIADLMNGAIVEPGQRLSINKHVGERTLSKGFKAAPAIKDGVVIYDDVGGGISQFITTFFNAAFFSGADLVTYQSHSIYYDRYPRGLEATISWGGPEQIIRNNSKYAILVWTERTSTSVTVTFYSTKLGDVRALPAVEKRQGEACTKVIVGRSINGRIDSDAVVASYRDEEGYNCDGLATPAQLAKEAEEAQELLEIEELLEVENPEAEEEIEQPELIE